LVLGRGINRNIMEFKVICINFKLIFHFSN